MTTATMSLAVERADILRAKYRYGFWYGIAVGLGFSIFNWGIDSYILSTHHGLQPWLRFIVGALLCMVVGSVTGWLSARLNRLLYAVIAWLVTASFFAWLSVNLTVLITPKLLTLFVPQTRGLLDYTYYSEFGTRVFVAYIWIAIFISMAGLLQILLSDSAVFSATLFGKLGPFLIVLALTGICGTIVDNGLMNEPLRSATLAVDNTIQYIIDHRGQEVDKTEARLMHTGAFRSIDDSVTGQRELIVGGYDAVLGKIDVLVKFERDWVDCQVFYNQPTYCVVIQSSP